jgi:FdhE protein
VANFLRRWFGGSKAAPPVEEARAELDRLCADRPALRPLYVWLRELLPDLAPDESVTPPPLTVERAREKLVAGVPLLRGETLTLDDKGFRRRWKRACDALETAQSDGAAAPLAEAMRRDQLKPADLITAVLSGRGEEVRERAASLGLDPGLTTTLLRHVLFPTFTGLEAKVSALQEGVAWERGYCPTCGSWPLLAEFRGLEQTRWLRCGLCAAGWEAARLWCPFCGCQDHEQLALLHAEGEETRYRAAPTASSGS